MNFYLLSVFVIFCFGPWTIAKEVYQRLSKNSAEVTEDKKLNADARFPIMNGFVQVTSQAQTWIHCLRKLLKAVKKWCNSHPYEVKLGKCFASYLNNKMSGQKQPGKMSRYSEGPKGAESSWKISRKVSLTQRAVALYTSPKSSFSDNLLDGSFISLYFWDLLMKITNRFLHYRDILLKDSLIMCAWDYFWKKFWTWVDLTPDSQCKI